MIGAFINKLTLTFFPVWVSHEARLIAIAHTFTHTFFSKTQHKQSFMSTKLSVSSFSPVQGWNGLIGAVGARGEDGELVRY